MNYKHLHYFQVVAEEGSVARAAERLHVAPQTISAQIAQLESSLDTRLIQRVGREWVVTDSGAIALSYAKDIFHKGKELKELLRGTDSRESIELVVGISDAIPKTVAYKLIEPALNITQPVTLRCIESSFDDLVGKLAVHSVDIVLADRPVSQELHVKVYNHLLHRSHLAVMSASEVKSAQPFPQNLHHLPFLMLSEQHRLSFVLDEWFEQQGIAPDIRGRFDDSALLKTFAKSGLGACCVPELIEQDVAREFGLTGIGYIHDVHEDYYGISVQRKNSHPAVQAMLQTNHE